MKKKCTEKNQSNGAISDEIKKGGKERVYSEHTVEEVHRKKKQNGIQFDLK